MKNKELEMVVKDYLNKEILSVFCKPLTKKHIYSVETNGILNINPLSNCKFAYLEMTTKHKKHYVSILIDKIVEYETLISHNIKNNSSYERPVFELDKAKEFSDFSFEKSFWKKDVKESYLSKKTFK